jgi:uncharacterized membrane-anchored protein
MPPTNFNAPSDDIWGPSGSVNPDGAPVGLIVGVVVGVVAGVAVIGGVLYYALVYRKRATYTQV